MTWRTRRGGLVALGPVEARTAPTVCPRPSRGSRRQRTVPRVRRRQRGSRGGVPRAQLMLCIENGNNGGVGRILVLTHGAASLHARIALNTNRTFWGGEVG